MKTVSSLLLSAFLFHPSAFAKIVVQKNKLFIEGDGNRTPLSLVNEMIKKKKFQNLSFMGLERQMLSHSQKKVKKKSSILSIKRALFMPSIPSAIIKSRRLMIRD